MIDLGAFTETVLLDDDGVYDPRQLKDRVLLGMKGSMAEDALGLLRQRAREAFEQKIRRGPVRWEGPVGCVRTEDDRIEKSADRQVQHAIAGVFAQLHALGRARQTTLWDRDAQLPLPEVHPGTAGHESIWRLPRGHRMNQILTNPCYAGALVYGRTAAKVVIEAGRAPPHARCQQPREQWRIVVIGHHPGSRRWEEFLQNQHVWEANRALPEDAPGGAVKRGAALRSGVLRCGRCGRKRNVVYSGTHGRVPRYVWRGGRVDRGASSGLTRGALRVDQAVATVVLDGVQPAGIHAAFEALEQVMAAHETQHQAVQLALEKARDEAQRARRHYDRVDPDNRLVAGEWERRWNEA